LASDRERFRQFFPDDDLNSTATPSTRGFDFDARARNPTARDFASPDYERMGDDDTMSGDPEMFGSDTTEGEMTGFNPADFGEDKSFTSLLFYLIQTTRRMDIIVNSRIRPVLKDLKPNQIEMLNNIYLMISTSFTDLIFPLSRRSEIYRGKELTLDKKDPFTKVKRNINPNINDEMGIEADIHDWILTTTEYGDEILNTFETERRKLLLNISVVVNSWKQNTPTGQQTQFTADVEKEFQRNLQDASWSAQSQFANYQYTTESEDGSAEGAGRKGGRRRKHLKSGSATLIGCGRNFYGEKINDSRDLPCLLSTIRDCPTKYLL
jgi:hypothetical protein